MIKDDIHISEDRSLSIGTLRKDFPILQRRVHGHPLIYLDSAATTQKPQVVLDALSSFYREQNANVHRGIHALAEEATASYEATRDRVARWLGGVERDEIVFTKGTTEAINLVAESWGGRNLTSGDSIVLTQMEHHANHIPWLQLAKRTGAEVKFIPITEDGLLDLDRARAMIDSRTKIVAFTHVSNLLGTINPAAQLIAMAHDAGAITLVDGAQSAPHMPLDLPDLRPDFFAFSAHKMLGPTGVGILYGRKQLLAEMEPYQTGGEMIARVSFEEATWADPPHRFEAGTPNIAGVSAFAAALDYLDGIGMDRVRAHERELVSALFERFEEHDWITVFGPRDPDVRGGVVSFEAEGIHPHDMAQFLDSRGVAVRAGHHCAQPLTRLLGRAATTRASFYIYNTMEEVDRLVEAIREARKYFLG